MWCDMIIAFCEVGNVVDVKSTPLMLSLKIAHMRTMPSHITTVFLPYYPSTQQQSQPSLHTR